LGKSCIPDNSKQDIQNAEYAESWLIIILESSAVEFLSIGTLDGRLWEELKIASQIIRNHSMFYPSILYRCIFHSNAPHNGYVEVVYNTS